MSWGRRRRLSVSKLHLHPFRRVTRLSEGDRFPFFFQMFHGRLPEWGAT